MENCQSDWNCPGLFLFAVIHQFISVKLVMKKASFAEKMTTPPESKYQAAYRKH
jgi:hypothetical protein